MIVRSCVLLCSHNFVEGRERSSFLSSQAVRCESGHEYIMIVYKRYVLLNSVCICPCRHCSAVQYCITNIISVVGQ